MSLYILLLTFLDPLIFIQYTNFHHQLFCWLYLHHHCCRFLWWYSGLLWVVWCHSG